jgi:hypothetical protein
MNAPQPHAQVQPLGATPGLELSFDNGLDGAQSVQFVPTW